ncbi:RHS repeat-associated protein [Mucilaginibacter gracilis]|uniref:RHS repeat-associated protein n=1 Tax=Mucilaginibacter gracilis TaxID=423350 RepID=A0A495IUZ8_9SPHI|nr:DUF6443 domain-containing protein [Mucilaginibacter gracilis]RKR80587.1 RHS repeat-associated protein [Mucilaginibacter gracilis]
MKIRTLSSKQRRYTLLVVLCLSIFQGKNTYAQRDTTLNQPNQSGTFVAPHSIKLSPGFSTAAGATFRAYIDPSLGQCVALNTTLSNNQNYIATYTPRIAGITNPADPNNTTCQVMASVQYFDGLGRPIQTTQVKGSPNLQDVVQPFVYDQFGRETKKYQPFISSTANGSFKVGDPDALVKAFYNPSSPGAPAIAATLSPFAETQFEPSPLNRVTQQGAPGDAWQLSQGHAIQTTYSTNAANEVKIWNVTTTGADGSTYYQPNTLYKTITTDENGNISTVFKDKENKIVLKQVQSDNGLLSTYSVFDDLGNLRYVVPPLPAEVTLPSVFTESDAVFRNFIYAYHYDGRNRIIEKKLPGRGWQYIVYNKIDLPVMTQDAVQRAKAPQEWNVMKYNAFGQIVVSGIYQHSSSQANTSYRDYMQGQVDNQSAQWDNRDNSALGYSVATFPTAWTNTLLVNYYDDYSFIPTGNNNYASSATGVSNMTKSLVTGSKTNVLGTSTMLLTVNYYDDNGRLRESVGDNNIGGKDRSVRSYDFTNDITQIIRTHNSINGSVTVQNDITYDHMGRKKLIKEKITGSDGVTSSPIVLARYDYNEVGQLMTKYLHSEDYNNSSPDASSFLYAVNYTYNPRGWAKTISSPQFAMSLKYEENQRFNGDVTAVNWGDLASPNQNTFTYNYDKMSRMLSGSAADMSESGIVYDNVGNIRSLTRDGQTISYDYNYGGELGNRLNAVSGGSFGSAKYFQYNENGNVTHDDTRNISSIAYNVLSLPQTLSDNTGLKYEYVYDAAGNKLRSVNHYQNKTTDYDGGIQYENNSLSVLLTDEGQARRSGNSYIYEYWVKDQLGNTRIAFYKNPSTHQAELLQKQDYYPFGLGKERSPITSSRTDYQYNGKELQENLNILDYGKRFYDPVIARWHVQDPEAEKYYKWSPYNYVLNNPIRNIDPRGDTVRITITKENEQQDGKNEKSLIRIVGSKAFGFGWGANVDVYKMTVTDDVTGETSTTEYAVTRDSPEANKDPNGIYTGDDKQKYRVDNTTFEPKDGDKTYSGQIRSDYGHGQGPRVELSDRDNPGSGVADGRKNIQIHVGGKYINADGQTHNTGSEGCFTLTLKDASNEGVNRFIGDVSNRVKLNEAAGKSDVILINVQKRDENQVKNFNQR